MRRDRAAAIEVGDRSRYLQDSRVGPRAQREAVDRELEQALARRLDLAMLAQLARAHLRVAEKRRLAEALDLQAARAVDPRADRRRALALVAIGQLLVAHRRHLDMDIDSIEQRSRNPRAVALDNHRRAGAFVLRVGIKAARAW